LKPLHLTAYVDGSSKGNPGPAASAFILLDGNGEVILQKGRFIGEATNNFAEYRALLDALEAAKSLGARRLLIRSDSQLMVNQLCGRYKVKSRNLMPLFLDAVGRLRKFDSFKIEHIVREKNKEADKLANRAVTMRGEVSDVEG